MLAAGVRSAMVLAEWFSSDEDVRQYVAYKGWSEADFHGLRLAWAEARRPEVQALPDVATPEYSYVAPPPGPVTRVPPDERPLVSLETLGPPLAPHQPDKTR